MNLWRVVGASVRGPDHERDGSPCQDAWAAGSFGAGGVCLCLCDGAGSASHAEVGARVVATAVVATLAERAENSAASDALRSACAAGRSALLRTAADLGLAPTALACTLIAILCTDEWVMVAHLGDGAVVGQRAGSSELVVLSAPDRGEYVNETWFVTSAQWEAHLRICVHKDISALCVVTDGCEAAALMRGDRDSPFAPFFAPLFEFTAEISDTEVASAEVQQLLDGAAMRRSSGDDKTLAIVWREESP